MIVIVDYDMGNIASIKNMLHRVGYDDVLISSKREDIDKATKLILPGVGAFDQGMKNLQDRGLDEAITEAVKSRLKPILGICLGMQLLGRNSEEGLKEGLGVLSFDSVRFKPDTKLKVPHMGWYETHIKMETPLTIGLINEIQRYYYVHSYHAHCDDNASVLMTCDYGYEFASAVFKGNVYGVQFHPEKSHKFGMKIFENFIKA